MTDASPSSIHAAETRSNTLHLSPEAIQILHATIRSPTATVAPGQCLTDEIIAFALEGVLGFARPVQGQVAQYTYVHSQTLAADLRRFRESRENFKLSSGCGTDLADKTSLEAVRRVIDTDYLDTQTLIDKLAMPIYHDGHWSLAIYERTGNRIVYYDSLQSAHQSVVFDIRRMFADSRLCSQPPALHISRCKQQRGFWECGYAVLGYAARESDFDPKIDFGSLVGSPDMLARFAVMTIVCSQTGEMAARYNRSRLRNYVDFK